MVKIKSYKTSYIKKFYIKNICKFKNRFWRYGYKNNFDWFEKNIKYNDIHNLIFSKKKIIGYSCLREKKINLKKYFIIDTVCVNKKYQNNGFGKKLMIFNNQILKKKKAIGILTCSHKIKKFYSKCGWKEVGMYNKKIEIYKKYINIKSGTRVFLYT